MEQFFEFVAAHGVDWWFVEVMCRKRNGERGAPLASRLGFRLAVPANRGVESFKKLESKLEAYGRGQLGYDLMTRESPARAGRRVLLVDDLDGIRLDELDAWWAGALWAHQTSQGNFQALVIAPTGLRDETAQRVLRGLVERFDGDQGATGLNQLHRLPGSRNWKPSCIDAGGPFTTRHTLARGPLDAAQSARQILELSLVAGTARTRPPKQVAGKGNGGDNSSLAFSAALRHLLKGTSEASILRELGGPWLSHHDAREWPTRALENAKYELGWRPTRYRSGEAAGDKPRR